MNTPGNTAPNLGKHHHNLVLALLFFGVLMGALDISVVGPAIPSIASTIQMDSRSLSWIFNIYVLFSLIGIPLIARLSDRYGRRRLYAVSMALFAAGSLVAGLSDSFPMLLIGRAIQGFGASGIFPIALSVIGDLFPVDKRGRALGWIGAVFSIAFLVGPFMAGTLLHYFHWNALFLVNIPVALLLLVFSLFLLPSVPVDRESKPDWAGIILLGLALTLYCIALTNLDTTRLADSVLSPTVLPLFVFALILAAILFINEKMSQAPVLKVEFLRSRQVRLIGFISAGLGLFQSTVLFLPSLAVNLFTVTPSEASFMLAPLVVLTALGSPVNGRLVDRIGSRIVILYGLVIATVALLLFSFRVSERNLYYFACALLGFGISMRSALNYVILNETGYRDRATSQGMVIIFISLGQITGATLIGALAASVGSITEGFRLAFLVMALVAAVLSVMALFLKGRKAEVEAFKETTM